MAFVVSVIGVAAAGAATHKDADDAEGPLDIKEVELEGLKLGGDRHLKATVRTYEAFRRRDLGGGGFLTYFDSRGDDRWDFKLAMHLWKDGTPLCQIFDRAGFSRGGGAMNRNPASFSCTFVRSTLNPGDDPIHWRTRSVSYGETDSAPESGWYRHQPSSA